MRALAAVGIVWLLAAPAAPASPPLQPQVLLFTKTAGFRHDSIPAAVETLRAQSGLAVAATEDARVFTDRSLARYDVVAFLLTTGDVLAPQQQAALERFVRSGGGFVGVHSATDTEYDWPWYHELVGATFRSHAPVQAATVDIVDTNDPSTAKLPLHWSRTDEWYAFSAAPLGVHVLATLDERTYTPGDSAMGKEHPIAWERLFDGGRAWYTAGGHTRESWSDPSFVAHVVGGIRWATGLDAPRIVEVRRRGRVVTAHAPGCRRCVVVARSGRWSVRAKIEVGAVRLTLPRGHHRFSLRVENLLTGRFATVSR